LIILNTSYKISYMKFNLANAITSFRILLSFITVILLEIENFYTLLMASFLIVFVILLDCLDGYVARKMGISTEFGALYDITGDRIVEYIFWIYFSFVRITNFWYAIIVITRGEIVNTLRAFALKKGKKPFEIHQKTLTRFIVESPFMRTSYAILKSLTFSIMGIQFFLTKKVPLFPHLNLVQSITSILAITTVFICVIRGLPVILEARKYVK